MFDRVSRGEADKAIRIAQQWPSRFDSLGITNAMKLLQLLPHLPAIRVARFCSCRLRRFVADVSHSIQSRLNLSAANREVHRAIEGMNDGIRSGRVRRTEIPLCRRGSSACGCKWTA